MKAAKGLTFIDVLIGTSLVLIVFLGVFAVFQLGLKAIAQNQRRVVATALANQQIEQIRNLPYQSVGTIGAVLPFAEGVLETATATSLNGVGYGLETKIKYISDEADGRGEADNCDLDYKRAEVRVFWQGKYQGEVKLLTDVAPKDKVEEVNSCQTQPGGILSVSVFNAYGAMVNSPLIEIFDPGTETLIDSYVPFSGQYDFPLATSSYKVVVSKTGYSTERTYGIDEVATPEKPHPTILEGKLTEISFAIDLLSSFSVETLSPWGEDLFSDSFEDSDQISGSANVVIENNEVRLATDTQGYLSTGYVSSVSVSSLVMASWNELSWNDSEPAQTDLKYQIYYASGTDWYLVPDADLAGNSLGFDISAVDLSGLNPISYDYLRVRANLTTNATSVSPRLYDWSLSWITSQATPIQNINFLLRGNKIIGADEEENPVYKYSESLISNYLGQIEITNLEWDDYTFSLGAGSSLDLVGTNPEPQPINLSPDETVSLDLFFQAENSLLLTIQEKDTLLPIFSASTTLSSGGIGYEENQMTDTNGQTYFIPLESASYNLEVEAPGCLSVTSTFWISGDATKIIRLERTE